MNKYDSKKLLTLKEVFTKIIAKGIAKLYNLSDDFFTEDEERSKCCFLGEQCRILIDTKCVSCAFFKTKEQFIKDREEAKQKLIDEKKWDYFVGKYPILKGERKVDNTQTAKIPQKCCSACKLRIRISGIDL